MDDTVHISVRDRPHPIPASIMESELRDSARSSFISTNSSGTSGTSEADDSNYRDSLLSYSSIDSDRNSVFVNEGMPGQGLVRATSTRSMPSERLRLDSEGSEDGQALIKDIARKTLTRKTAIRRTHTLTPASSPKIKERRNRSISSTESPLAELQKKEKEYFTLYFDLRFYKQNHDVEAAQNVTLREAVKPYLKDADIDIRSIDIFIESSTSPTPLDFLVLPLSGRHLYVKAKAGKANNPLSSPSFAKKKMDEAESQDPSGDVYLGTSFQPHEKKKDLTKLLGLNQEEPQKSRRASVSPSQQVTIKDPAKEKVDPKFLKLQQTLDDFIINGLPDFPSLLTFTAKREDDHEAFEIENNWKDFTNEETINSLTKSELDQQEAIWEIVRTEMGYIKNIRVIVDFYLCTLINLQASLMLNEIETEKIFSNIRAIEVLHTRFWKEKLSNVPLNARKEKRIPSVWDLCEAFNGFPDLFAPYIKFCTDEHDCMKYLREKTEGNEMLRFFIEWAQRHPNSQRLKLQDLLVYPMQRITKYPLLLVAVQKKTKNEEELARVTASLQNVKEFVEKVNHELRQEQERQKMDDTISRLEAYEAVSVNSGNEELAKLVEDHCKLNLLCSMPNAPPTQARWLHMEGALKLRDADTRLDAYGFLFTDMLVLAKQKKNDNFRIIKPPMRVDMIKVQELKDGSGFALVHVDEYDCAVYGCVLSTSSATQWLTKIRKAQTLYNDLCTFEAEFHNSAEINNGFGEPPTSPEAMVFSLQTNAFPMVPSPLNSPRLSQRSFLGSAGEATSLRSASSLSLSSTVATVPEENDEGEAEEEQQQGSPKRVVREENGVPENVDGPSRSINEKGSTDDLLSSAGANGRPTFPPSKRQSLNDDRLRRSGVNAVSPPTSPLALDAVSKPNSLAIPDAVVIRSPGPVSPGQQQQQIMAFDDLEEEDDSCGLGFLDAAAGSQHNTSPTRRTSTQVFGSHANKTDKVRRKTAPAKPDNLTLRVKDSKEPVNGQEKSKGKSKMKYLKKFSTHKS